MMSHVLLPLIALKALRDECGIIRTGRQAYKWTTVECTHSSRSLTVAESTDNNNSARNGQTGQLPPGASTYFMKQYGHIIT